MKLPNLTSNMITGLQEARSERLNTLGQLLSMGIGSSKTATVEKLAPVTPEQRQQLLNRTLETLMQLTQKPASDTQRGQISQLLEQQQLLKSPLLKLVQVQINNRPLITYTDKPVQVGQQLTLNLAESNRLVQLADSPKPAAANSAQSASQNPTETQRLNQELLAQALRRVLPLRDQPALVDALPKIQSLPLTHRQELFTPSVQEALKNLAQQLRTPTQLSHPTLLRNALQNSGAFFERKLGRTLSTPGDNARPMPLDSAQAARLSAGDVKGALLQLLHRVGAELAQQGIQAGSKNPLPPGLALPTQVDLSQFLEQLANRARPELRDRVARTQLMMLLHQQTLSSLARVQFQQLHAVNHQQAQAETGQPTQSWVLEVPVKYGQENHNLQLELDQDWVEREGDGRESRKVRQWQLLLSFPLPEAGNFYAQLTLVENQVAAKLWAEQPGTLQEAKEKMAQLKQQLEAKGIEVTRLECLAGAPPLKARPLEYALVDVTT